MKLSRCIFSNYKKFRNANLKLDSNITILIGQNNAGKTTILEGVVNTISSISNFDFSKYLSKILKDDASIKIHFRIDRQELIEILDRLSLQHNDKDDLLIHQEFTLECIYSKPDNILTRKLDCNDRVKDRYKDFPRLRLILEKLQELLNKSTLFLKPDLQCFIEPLIPNDKNLVLDNKRHLPLNYLFYIQKEQKDEFDKFNDIIRRFFDDLVQLELEHIKPDNKITVKVKQRFKNQQNTFDIDEMGEGFRKALSMVMRIYVSDSKVILIDEPDSRMHPKLIKDYASYLSGLGKQIIISSHNEIFINEFDKDKIKYILYKSSVYSIIEDSKKLDASYILADLGINSIYTKSLLVASDIILLVEGEDDERYIKWLLEKTKLDQKVSTDPTKPVQLL